MAITAGGIGSGLDIQSLVNQLVAAEGQPATLRLDRKEAAYQADLSAYGTLKSALSTFQDNIETLNDPAAFQKKLVSSSDPELFAVSGDDTAIEGTYNIEVIQLARAARLNSGDFAAQDSVVGTGSLSISLGADNFQLTIDSSNHTLSGIRDAINDATDNPGIKAAIVNVSSTAGGAVARLMLSSDKMGAANTISIAVTDDDGENVDNLGLSQLATDNLTVFQAAQDAIVSVDGDLISHTSNSLSDVVTGVDFTLKKAAIGTIETLTVSLDTGGVKSKIDSFVDAYNNLASTMSQLASYNADGPLAGDSLLRGLQSQIRQQMTTAVSGLNFGTLAEMGIATDDSGNLAVDSAKLDAVFESDYSDISELFTSENGLAISLNNIVEGYIKSAGIIDSRTEGLQSRIDSISDDRDRLEIRLLALEQRYQAQFTAMDTLVAQLRSTGDYLTQQLANLPKPNSINSNN